MISQTKGGLNTKIHTIVDGLGNPVGLLLPAGNGYDLLHTVELLEKVNSAAAMYW